MMNQPALLIALLVLVAIVIYLVFVVREQQRVIDMGDRLRKAQDEFNQEATKALRKNNALYDLIADRIVQLGEIKILEADRARDVITLCEIAIKEARAAIAEATK